MSEEEIMEELRQLFLEYVKHFIGVPYLWAGDDPMKGFDCCFPKDTPILTTKGYKKIQEIEPKEKVWSFDFKEGKLKKCNVLNLFKNGKQEIYEIRTRCSRIKASHNHPFLVIERGNGKPGWEIRNNTKLVWKRFCDLKRDDSLIILNKYKWKSKGINYSDEFIWFLGAMLGDGHITDNRHVYLAFYNNKLREKARSKIEKITNNKIIFHKTHGIYFSDVKIVNELIKNGFQTKSFERKLPKIVWEMNKRQVYLFLEGYIDSDGYGFIRKRKGKATYSGIRFASCYKNLIYELQLLLRMLKGRTENVYIQKRNKDILIKGKKVKNAKDMYVFTWYPESKRNGERKLNIKNFRDLLNLNSVFGVERVLEIKKVQKEPTYNLETELNTFIAENFIVHNSGLAVEGLKGVGLLPRTPKFDLSAEGLYNYFKEKEIILSQSKEGCLVFWKARNSNKIVHVEIVVFPKTSINADIITLGASGGTSKTKTIEDAIKSNAFIKYRKARDRQGLYKAVDPFMIR